LFDPLVRLLGSQSEVGKRRRVRIRCEPPPSIGGLLNLYTSEWMDRLRFLLPRVVSEGSLGELFLRRNFRAYMTFFLPEGCCLHHCCDCKVSVVGQGVLSSLSSSIPVLLDDGVVRSFIEKVAPYAPILAAHFEQGYLQNWDYEPLNPARSREIWSVIRSVDSDYPLLQKFNPNNAQLYSKGVVLAFRSPFIGLDFYLSNPWILAGVHRLGQHLQKVYSYDDGVFRLLPLAQGRPLPPFERELKGAQELLVASLRRWNPEAEVVVLHEHMHYMHHVVLQIVGRNEIKRIGVLPFYVKGTW